jgi:hypothetical protein
MLFVMHALDQPEALKAVSPDTPRIPLKAITRGPTTREQGGETFALGWMKRPAQRG